MPVRRLLSLVLLVLAGTAPAARAAQVTLAVDEGGRGVHYGQRHTVTGTLTADDGGTPLVGERVVLEGRPFPFDDPFERLATATTAADGTFTLKVKLSRNTRLRAVVGKSRSQQVTAHLLPASSLGFRQVEPGVVRITALYRVPPDVRLGGKTLFYVGPHTAKTSKITRRARTRRVTAGRYRARVTLRLPASYGARFRYAMCYRYTPGSGLGDPKISCPRSGYRF